jgi:hypothetical protein
MHSIIRFSDVIPNVCHLDVYMNEYINTCIHVYMHTGKCTSTYAYIYIYIYIYMVNAQMQRMVSLRNAHCIVCVVACMKLIYACVYINDNYVYVCMYVCMCIYIYICVCVCVCVSNEIRAQIAAYHLVEKKEEETTAFVWWCTQQISTATSQSSSWKRTSWLAALSCPFRNSYGKVLTIQFPTFAAALATPSCVAGKQLN